MLQQEQVLKIVNANGPLLPAKIAKALGTDNLIASAMLSELASTKKIKISNTKIGGSPVYYAPGQEPKLQDLYQHLNDKDKSTYDLLKERKILNDEEQEPLTRVSLRGIKDFAVPLNVKNDEKQYLFWKWYLLSNTDAEKIIQSILEPAKQQQQQEAKLQAIQQQQKQDDLEEHSKKQKQLDNEFEEKKKLMEKEMLEHERSIQQQRMQLEKEKLELEKQKYSIEKQRIATEAKPKLEPKIEFKSEPKINIVHSEQKHDKQLFLQREPVKPKEQDKKQKIPEDYNLDPFFSELEPYFKQKQIKIIEGKLIKKNGEIDFVLRIPSVVGELEYFCKARNKKKISDADITAAYVSGQLRKLQTLLLVNGELTKKAKELLLSEFSKNVVVQKI